MIIKKPLKILILSYDWRNIFEKNFNELAQKMKRDRLAPEFNNLFILSWSPKSYCKKSGNIETVHLKAFLGKFRVAYDFLLLFLTPIILLKKKFYPDIIFVRDFPLTLSSLFIKIFFRSRIVFFLGSMPTRLAKSRNFSFLRWLFHYFSETTAKHFIDCFIANGAATKNYLRQIGIKEEKIKIMVEDVIERDKEIINVSTKDKIRNFYNISADRKIILSIGRLEEEKNFSGLLKAFAQLKRDDLTLIIVGDGVLKNKLKAEAENLVISDRVIFAGFIPHEKIWDYYKDADIFILFSFSEGSPTVFREAMYMGVPVIGSKIEAIKEFIGDNEERGFLWGEEDKIGKLAEKINFCLSGSSEFKKMTERAKRFIEENIKVNYNINDYVDL
ncbi:glycosyltransferase [Candidatus Falkowbacteria bacterium]|nr:glycosyltransferase [Candidatus Falkowbacteria bacterium]